jgi:hypothetical protein
MGTRPTMLPPTLDVDVAVLARMRHRFRKPYRVPRPGSVRFAEGTAPNHRSVEMAVMELNQGGDT